MAELRASPVVNPSYKRIADVLANLQGPMGEIIPFTDANPFKFLMPAASTFENLAYGNAPLAMPPGVTNRRLPIVKTGREGEFTDLASLGLLATGVPQVARGTMQGANYLGDVLTQATRTAPPAASMRALTEVGQMPPAQGVLEETAIPIRNAMASKGEATKITREGGPIQSAVVLIGDKIFTGQTHGQALNRAIYEGAVKKEGGKYIYPKDAEVNTDLFMTKDGRIIDRLDAYKEFDIGASETAIEKGLMQVKPASSMTVDQYIAEAEKKIAGLLEPQAGARPMFETGREVTFPFIKNTEKAPKTTGFAQEIEPAGNYILSGEDVDVAKLPQGWTSGEVTFKNPLVLGWGKSGLYSEPDNWKQVLSNQYGGKTGKALSRAVAKDGYDGIVTINEYGPSEIVDLTMFAK